MTRSMSRLRRSHFTPGMVHTVQAGTEGGGGSVTVTASAPEPPAASASNDPGRGEGTDGDKPISEMTDAERAAYFERKANRYRDTARARGDYEAIKAERDALKQAGETDTDKAVREAREAARAEGRAEALRESSTTTVRALLEGAMTVRNVPENEISEAIKHIDPASFLTDTGDVDHTAIVAHATRLAGSGTAVRRVGPDLGQGNRGDNLSRSGMSAGADMFTARRGTKQ